MTMHKTVPRYSGAVKRSPAAAEVLSQQEVTRLVDVYIRGKSEILEDDVLAVVRWATAQRMGIVILDMVLSGDLVPVVEDGEVKVGLPVAVEN
jgi:hypothetical protein